jgi:hypothetical protein
LSDAGAGFGNDGDAFGAMRKVEAGAMIFLDSYLGEPSVFGIGAAKRSIGLLAEQVASLQLQWS